MDFDFIDNSETVKEELKASVLRALEKCGLTAEGYAKINLTNNGSVDTGNLRNSITHQVDEEELAAYIGSAVEYSAYVELGTGEHYPGGRPTPWVYQDAKGNWHYTRGNPAKPYLKPAVAENAQTYRNIIEDELKNG